MKETRKQLAAAMTAHALAKLASAEWEPFTPNRGDDFEIRSVWCGEFHLMHSRRPGWQQRGALLDDFSADPVRIGRQHGRGNLKYGATNFDMGEVSRKFSLGR